MELARPVAHRIVSKQTKEVTMEATNMHLIRLPEVLAICGLSRSTVYAYAKRGQFPTQIKITPNAAGWVKEEVQAWVESRVCAHRGA